MPSKPHNQSVTSKPRVCGFLEAAAAEPNSMILYDERMGEYQFNRRDESDSGPILSLSLLWRCDVKVEAGDVLRQGHMGRDRTLEKAHLGNHDRGRGNRHDRSVSLGCHIEALGR